MVAEPRYDEGALGQRVMALDRPGRAAFASSCAERLWPLVERYATVVSMPADQLTALRHALDLTWDAMQGQDADVTGAQELAEAMIPADSDPWVPESGYAESAIAAIAYAARTWLTNDTQAAVWAARQVYELGDYAAQLGLAPGLGTFSVELEARLRSSPVVEAAVRGIMHSIDDAERQPVTAVRERCRAEAPEFAALVP